MGPLEHTYFSFCPDAYHMCNKAKMNIYKYSIYKSVCDKFKMTSKDQTNKQTKTLEAHRARHTLKLLKF